MKLPWANITLLILLVVQLATGFFGLVNGRGERLWILWLHGLGAYGLLVVLLWKGQIIWDAVRRKRVWTRARLAFIGLLGLLLLVIVSGLIWTFAGPRTLGGFSLVSLHIYLAIPLMGLMLWHAWRMRFVLRLRETWGRRLFLGSLTAVAGGLLLYPLTNLFKRERRFTGSYETGSFTGVFPVVSWIADRAPAVDVATFRLVIDGAVARPLALSYDDLRALATDELTAVLDCTGGWYSAQVWRGISIGRLLAGAERMDTTRSVTVQSQTGFKRRFSLAEMERYLLALDVAGEPLSRGHGFPCRLVAPDQRGVEWVKWVVRLTANTTGPEWQLPLPLQ